MSEMKENKAFSCAVARDLMPLYVENLTEDETTEWMRGHIADCPACAQSYGMQKTKLEIEKKPQRPDFRGIRFFKKSFLKRIALVMAVAIMGFMILLGGYGYLFTNHMIDENLIRVVGQYELTDGRIVIALQADGHAVSNTLRYRSEWANHNYYTYDDQSNRVAISPSIGIDAGLTLSYDRFDLWTKKEDERGNVFYYIFDPNIQDPIHHGFSSAFATPPPTALLSAANDMQQEEKLQSHLNILEVNTKKVWRAGDPLRKLTAEEEEVLLRAMEIAGFTEGSALLPQTDILDSLMGK